MIRNGEIEQLPPTHDLITFSQYHDDCHTATSCFWLCVSAHKNWLCKSDPSYIFQDKLNIKGAKVHTKELGRKYCRMWGVIPLMEKSSQIARTLNLCRAMAILMLFAHRKARSMFTYKILQRNWLAHNTFNFLLM